MITLPQVEQLAADFKLYITLTVHNVRADRPDDYACKIYDWMFTNMPEELESRGGKAWIDPHALQVALFSLGWEEAT